MAKLTEEKIKGAFQPQLQDGEELTHWAFGVKQPNIFLIMFLFLLAILPGAIATALLTKNYLIGLTGRRFIILHIKGFSNAAPKEIIEYSLDELRNMKVHTSTGGIFTHIHIDDPNKPFKAKFHRAFSKTNRPHAMAIAEAISGPKAA